MSAVTIVNAKRALAPAHPRRTTQPPAGPDHPYSGSTVTRRGFRSWSVGAKLTIIIFFVVGLTLLALIELINYGVSGLAREQAIKDLQARTQMVVSTLDLLDNRLRTEVNVGSNVLKGYFRDGLTLDTSRTIDADGIAAPVIKSGNVELNGNFTNVDDFTARSKAVATIFVRKGDEFIRVSTSLKKDSGERAIGTMLDHANPAYDSILKATPYVGMASLFGKFYMTRYEPILDGSNQVIGISFVGLDFSEALSAMKDKIRAMKIGDSGYFYALDATEGKNYGTLMIHPTKEGQNILASKDAAGNEFIKDILQRRSGNTSYPWLNKERGETSPREKIVAFAPMPNWNWIVAAGVYVDEYTEASNRLAHRYQLVGIVLVLLMGAGLYFFMRRVLSAPLQEATEAAKRLAGGDLSATVTVARMDEIGQLMGSINSIGKGLEGVVRSVQEGAAHINTVSQEVAAGNADLSARTESQASSLEETAASMEELTSTVKQTADSANTANKLALTTAQIANKGGESMTEVLSTMDSIKASSTRIVDIISVIDGIAFQTNILALNAAVEAARAGEQGRGFAVVASEVRNLAQRSASAAKEIAQLIKDSVGMVDQGHQVAEQAGLTMNEIQTSVGQVTQIMAEITHASREQSAGIEQVNEAIMQMEQITQQNAALVEQAASATEAMHKQALELVREVDKFKLG